MQRYHDTSNDPLPLHSTQHQAEQRRIELATREFLAKGGQIKEVGFQMSKAAPTFTINPERTPVHSHIFEVQEEPLPLVTTACSTTRGEASEAAAVMAAAALGDAPKWIAKKLHMTEKRVRQIARDYRINFHSQR